ncbi:MAG TPA: hypothetical protein VE988_05695 [Gemmataceae bacterium]|nr:hypothetical protein [Gemmataceae bacterium]
MKRSHGIGHVSLSLACFPEAMPGVGKETIGPEGLTIELLSFAKTAMLMVFAGLRDNVRHVDHGKDLTS